MFSYSTCLDCGELLHVTEINQTVHPGCAEPRPTKLQRLAEEWLAAAEMGDQPELEESIAAEIEDIENHPKLGEAAQLYASWGWPVFPLLPLSRAREIAQESGDPFDKVAKRPATKNGVLNASTDVARITAWWTRHPDSNVALATGHLFDVVDIDPRNGGTETYQRLLEMENPKTNTGPIPDVHGKVTTASGGLHLYIEPTGGGNFATTPSRPALQGIDFRGKGGYVVAPPSWLGDHRRWSWQIKPSPRIRK